MTRRRSRSDPVAWLTARDGLWAAIRALGLDARDGFTIADVAGRARVHRDTARSYLIALWRAGILTACPPERAGNATVYRLTEDPGSETPSVKRDGTIITEPSAQERLWLAMKPLGSFTVPELVMACAGAVTEVQAKSYVGRLFRAGYLDEVAPSRTGGKQQPQRARYRLRLGRDTGPRPPAVRRDRTVFDLNLGRIVGPEDVL